MLSASGFSTKEDVLRFIQENNIRILDLLHIPEEGRLKALSFSTANAGRIEDVLEFGERVDGSSLFSSIEPGKSDIYIVPRVHKTFVNPFPVLPTLSILCDYLDENGKPLEIAPQNVLMRAQEKLQSSNRVALRALAELEFYVFSRQQDEPLFTGASDRNYHESSPFSRYEGIRNEVLTTLGIMGIATKYGHSEVGRLQGNGGVFMEQHEIEFMPEDLNTTADAIAIAKWTIRNVCQRHGISASFIPKIDLNHAGNGMHIHLCAFEAGKNIVSDVNGELSKKALGMIGGILRLAPSLAAFGNPTPVSYLRFMARKESPMHICWSARNRLALIRIPLWWKFRKKIGSSNSCRETFEYRAPDAFANPHLLLAGLTMAVHHGLHNAQASLKLAEDLRAESISDEKERFKTLPSSCSEAAKHLASDRRLYEIGGVFPKKLIDKTIQKLEDYNDSDLWQELSKKPDELHKMLMGYLHYG